MMNADTPTNRALIISNSSSSTDKGVFFDDVTVEHQYSPLIQTDSYFPFGGTFNNYTRATAQPNKYLFNGNEWQPSWKVYDFNARFYDPWGGPGFLQIDPMAEEREWLTPYNFAQNNPINRVDPDGRFDDFYIYSDGSIDYVPTGPIDNFYFVDDAGTSTFLGSFTRNANGLIQLPSNYGLSTADFTFNFQVKGENEYRSFINPDAFAALFGSLITTNTTDLTVIGFSLTNGDSPDPSRSHINGINGDVRYLRTDQSGERVLVNQLAFDVVRNERLSAAFRTFGWTSQLSERTSTSHFTPNYILPGATHYSKSRHNNHLHLQGFRPNINLGRR